jgi:hypothetical protein
VTERDVQPDPFVEEIVDHMMSTVDQPASSQATELVPLRESAPADSRPTEVVFPVTGEIVSLSDPAACARTIADVVDLIENLKDLKSVLDTGILDEYVRVGTKTLHLEGGFTATITTPSEIVWDHDVLLELLDAGLPKERYDRLVKEEVRRKVDQSVVKQLEGANPQYKAIIDRARNRIPKREYVKIERAAL